MKRLLSLDVLRGITVCGMILVNNAGGSVSYAPLRHSVWNGLTPCDLVFPFFLFMVGISTYISLRKFDFRSRTRSSKRFSGGLSLSFSSDSASNGSAMPAKENFSR